MADLPDDDRPIREWPIATADLQPGDRIVARGTGHGGVVTVEKVERHTEDDGSVVLSLRLSAPERRADG
ncbi:hypothetical protein MXD63_14380 [Frankia sp. Cpl3]|nr:hypothetical protein [Frankia sp. Cpl3]